MNYIEALPVENIMDATKAVKAANNRFKKSGFDAEFSIEFSDAYFIHDPLAKVVDATVHPPKVVIGDWFVKAMLEKRDGSVVVSSHVSMEADDITCDHCNKTNPLRSYIIENVQTGEEMQVAASCMKEFFGRKIRLLRYSFTHDVLADVPKTYRTRYYPVPAIVSTAMQLTNGGWNYVSRKQQTSTKKATVDEVLAAFDAGREVDYADIFIAVKETVLAKKTESGWIHSLQKLLQREAVQHQYVGTLVSVVKAFYEGTNEKS